MQGSCSKLNWQQWTIILMAVSVPLFAWAVCLILPTYDDWTTLSAPNYTSHHLRFVLPYGVVWRPWDAIMGFLLTVNHRAFPVANHLVIFAGHVISTILIYKVCRKLDFDKSSTTVATLFFYLSPAMLGTLLSCDSMNQTYSQLWGIAALLAYLSYKGWRRYVLWALCVVIGALAKENGIAWAVVPPIIGYGFQRDTMRSALRGVVFGIAVAVAYAAFRLSLPKTELINTEYTTYTLYDKVMDICTLIGYSWTAIDWVSLFHRPSRNIIIVAITMIMSLPLLYYLFVRQWKRVFSVAMLSLVVAVVAVQSPHIVTVVSVMHCYGSLSICALILAYLLNDVEWGRGLVASLVLFLLASLYTDWHHWQMSVITSRYGKEFAQKALEITPEKPQKVMTINVTGDERKYSSFCVTPIEAFENGYAVMFYTDYEWPKNADAVTITEEDYQCTDSVVQITRRCAKEGYDCVWMLRKAEDKWTLSVLR